MLSVVKTGFERVGAELSGLEISPDYQLRSALDEEHIEDLRAALASGSSIEEIVIYRVDGRLILVDGFHRVEAAKRIGLPSLPAKIHTASEDEARLFVTNKDHPNFKNGKKYGHAEKREAIERTLIMKPEWSDVRIADHCGVSDKTVASCRKDLNLGNSEVVARVGKDNKKRRTQREDQRPNRVDPRKVSAETTAIILEMAAAGDSNTQIAQATDLSESTVSRIRNEHGVSSSQQNKEKKEPIRRKAAELYADNVPIERIIEITGLSPETIHRARDEFGIPKRTPAGRTIGANPIGGATKEIQASADFLDSLLSHGVRGISGATKDQIATLTIELARLKTNATKVLNTLKKSGRKEIESEEVHQD